MTNKRPQNTVVKEIIAVALLALAAMILNRKVHISWMFIDDLNIWDWYRCETFWEFTFPKTAGHLRTVSWAAIWLLFKAAGTNMQIIIFTLIALLVFTAVYLRRFFEELSGSYIVSVFLSLVFVASRFSYYNVSQVLGLTEALSLMFAVFMCRRTWRYLHDANERNISLGILYYVLATLSHERYMVLLPILFYVVTVNKKEKRKALWVIITTAVFVALQFARWKVIGSILPAGTGGSDVVADFTKKGFVLNVLSQLAYMVGINAGPEWLCGTSWQSTPVLIKGLVVIFLALLVRIFMIFFGCVKERKRFPTVEFLFFAGFVIGLVTASSVAVRLEMRWIYVSFTAALLLMAYLHGFCLETKRTNISLLLILACLLMIFCDIWYRDHEEALYLEMEQRRRESFIEKTYGAFGDRVVDIDIYILKNFYNLREYEEKLFNKPIGLFEGTLNITHVDSMEEIPADGKEKIVLYEIPEKDVYEYVGQ